VARALLGGDGADAPVAVAEIGGGCACCAARVAFDATLVRLLRRGPWDRLIVEATGLGHPHRLVDQLRAPAFAGRLRVRAPIAVVDARRAARDVEAARPGHAIAADQLALARVLVLNRAAELDPQATQALAATLAERPPWPRAVLATARGCVPLATVLAALEAVEGPAGAAGGMATDLPAPDPIRRSRATAQAWWWPADTVFDRARLRAALDALAAVGGPFGAGGMLRAKGVFRTTRAWYAWQWVEGRIAWDETAWRADSRFELIADGSVDLQAVDTALRAAVSQG
jgi:G3E family GTPase